MINVLALTGSLYMMQIYDRALTSGSIPTLLVLSALAIGLYLFQGCFDVIRSQVLVRVGARLDKKIAPLAHRVAIDMPRFGFSTSEALERGRDVDTVRGFLGSQGPAALFDLPWMPIYLVFIYFLHPLLGALTFAGAFVLTVLTIVSEIMTQAAQPGHPQGGDGAQRHRRLQRAQRRGAARPWASPAAPSARFNDANARASRAADPAPTTSAARSPRCRACCACCCSRRCSGSAPISPSRANCPPAPSSPARSPRRGRWRRSIWRSATGRRSSPRGWPISRLRDTVVALAAADEPMQLPAPRQPSQRREDHGRGAGLRPVVLSDVSFELEAGQALGIIGPSGGGKTTLVRALTGIWPLLRGSVRLDGADLTQWREEELGQHIGYLPQEVSLLDATIEENICRLRAAARFPQGRRGRARRPASTR